VSCCREAMSRLWSSVGILTELFVLSGADSIGRGGRAPTFTNETARDTVSRRTANKKLAKLY